MTTDTDDQNAITPDHENEHALAALLGTDGMVHPSIMQVARRHPGWVIDRPGIFGGLLTRANYIRAYDEFAAEHPEVLAAVEQRRASRRYNRQQQALVDRQIAELERQKGRVR